MASKNIDADLLEAEIVVTFLDKDKQWQIFICHFGDFNQVNKEVDFTEFLGRITTNFHHVNNEYRKKRKEISLGKG